MFFEKLRQSFNKKKQSNHILWSSAAYFSDLSRLDHNEIQTKLNWDLISFLHEYVGLINKKTYSYGQQGIMDSYEVKTSQKCLNHEQWLAKQGFEVSRARLETKAALTLESWMDDQSVSIGEKLVMISPRGKESEGYPGLDPENYIFINIYIKVGESDFQLVQYTSYAREKELLQLQSSLTNELNGDKYSTAVNDQLDIKPQSISHQIIDTPILLKSDVELSNIENLIYQDEKSWATTREQLPQVDESEFNKELEEVLTVLSEQFWILSKLSPVVAIQHFDQLITIVRENFLKWVEDHAQNYDKDENFAPYALNLENIITRWQLTIKEQEDLSKKEKKQLTKLQEAVKLNPLQPLMKASSVAHCIIGTPSSLAINIAKLNPTMFSLSSPEFISLPTFEKNNLLERIKSERMTEIILDNGETWMVPVSFLDEKGCYVGKDGVSLGPCNIPLLDSFAFQMNQFEFNQFVYELEQQILGDQLDKTEKDILEEFLPGSEQSEQLKDFIIKIKKIIFKPIVSLTELISGDLLSSSLDQNESIRKIIYQLKYSINPLKTCEIIIKNLLEEQNGVLSFGEV